MNIVLDLVILWAIFSFPCTWFHEFGHLLAAKRLGYRPTALCFSLLVFPTATFRESTGNNKTHEKIITMAGPLSGFLVVALLGWIITAISDLCPPIVWGIGFSVAFVISGIDLVSLFWWISHFSEGERNRKAIKSIPPGRWVLVFSKNQWRKLKKKLEKQMKEKIDIREVVLG